MVAGYGRQPAAQATALAGAPSRRPPQLPRARAASGGRVIFEARVERGPGAAAAPPPAPPRGGLAFTLARKDSAGGLDPREQPVEPDAEDQRRCGEQPDRREVVQREVDGRILRPWLAEEHRLPPPHVVVERHDAVQHADNDERDQSPLDARAEHVELSDEPRERRQPREREEEDGERERRQRAATP